MAANETLDETKSKGILWGFSVLTLTTLVVLLILGAWWGSEPGQFNIQDEARKRVEESKLESNEHHEQPAHTAEPATVRSGKGLAAIHFRSSLALLTRIDRK